MAVARVRLADLRCPEGVASAEFIAAVGAASGSLTATGALIIVLDDAAADAVDTALAAGAVLFAAPEAEKRRFAATSDASGAPGYRALNGKQVYDFRLNGATPSPDVVARTAPRAYAHMSAAGRAVLAALSWCRLAGAGAAAGEAPADLAALCEPAPLPPQRQGASVLSLFRYDAGGGAAAPHVDRGLLTLVASTDAGLELRDPADDARWLRLPLRRGEVAVLVGATLAAATGHELRAATHRVAAQPTPRGSAVLRLRGAPEALLPRLSVAAFEKAFEQTHVSVNRDGGGASASGADEVSGGNPGAAANKRPRGMPQPAPADETQINIRVKDQDSTEVHFKVRPDTKFEKIFEAYCMKKNLSRGHVRFLFDANLIRNGRETPAQWGMESGDARCYDGASWRLVRARELLWRWLPDESTCPATNAIQSLEG